MATGSYDRSINILMITNTEKELNKDDIKILYNFKHKFRISIIDWDPFNPARFLNACQKHVTIQVWTLDPE